MTTAATKYLLAVPLFYLLYVFGLSASGLLGPDEPRYASIARDMAKSGDWITPVLWGEPWFEKPPLLYWMSAAGFRLGLGTELAPRLPVALLSIAFIVFYFVLLRREFGPKPALYSSLILSTSAGWVALSHAAVPDLPLAATFNASMLLGLRWMRTESRSAWAGAGILLGFAILAKGLVPLVLSLPLFWMNRRRLLYLALLFGIALCVAAPWLSMMTLRHGSLFWNDLFWKHHFERFLSDSLQHVRPFWYYAPVLLAGIFPWTPLLLVLLRAGDYDQRRKFLAALVIFGFVFFSVTTNKLPGYVLPLMPPLCALLGLALAERTSVPLLAACAALIGLVPTAGRLLPQALASGLSRAEWSIAWIGIGAGVALGALVWWTVARGRSFAGVCLVALGSLAGVLYLKVETLPRLDREVSARALWKSIEPRSHAICIDQLDRGWRYGIYYYAGAIPPDCGSTPGMLHLNQSAGGKPLLGLP